MNRPKRCDLDGIFYRVKVGDKYVNRCFSDLTSEEMYEFMQKYDKEGLTRLLDELLSRTKGVITTTLEVEEMKTQIVVLALVLHNIGEGYGITGGDEDDD